VTAPSTDEQWFAGLPVVGERMLSEEERAELARARRTLGIHVARRLGMLVLLAAAIAVGEYYAIPFRAVPILVLVYFIFRGKTASAGWQLRWYRDLTADATGSHIVICRGALAQAVRTVDTTAGKQQFDVPADEETLTVEVLPLSGMVWTVNGHRPVQPMFTPRSRTSRAPEHARMAANFVAPVAGADGLYAHRRALNEAEQEELQTYLKVTHPLHLAAMLLMVVLGCIFIATSLPNDALGLAAGALLLLAGGSRLFVVARRLRLARRLRADAREAYVVIVRRGDGEELGEATEFLPLSRVIWSQGGRPATWRRISARR
jgi:TRAP-type mannitol/chloroaromatic compound transport system permease large subunit